MTRLLLKTLVSLMPASIPGGTYSNVLKATWDQWEGSASGSASSSCGLSLYKMRRANPFMTPLFTLDRSFSLASAADDMIGQGFGAVSAQPKFVPLLLF